MARAAAGRRTSAGEQRLGRQWEAQAGEAFLDLREWRAVHPKATLAAIEAELDRRLEALRARMLADMALASRAADLQSEERAACPTCGTALHDGGSHQRTLVTMGNQQVELVRDYGTCPGCGSGHFPLDAELGLLTQQRYSPRVEETLVQLATETTFGKAVRLLRRLTGVRTSKATARRRTYAAGGAALALEAAAQAQLVADPPPVQPSAECLQLSIDATKIPLVGGLWTEAKLGSIARMVQGRAKDGTPVAEAVDLTYAARWEPAEQFGQTCTVEAQRRQVDGAALVVSPNDGALWIQGIVDLIAPQAVRILDEPHGAEHLTLISQLVFGPTSLAGTDWVARQRTALLEDPDGPRYVLAALDQALAQGPHPLAPRTVEAPDPAKALAREVAYFHTRADEIRYVAFRQAGYPIGSGCVESGHGVVITPRFKGAGRRWAAAHLNPLLVLRTIEANDRWETTWPTIWGHLLTSGSHQRLTAQQQRRTLRLLDASAPTSATPPLVDTPATPTAQTADPAPALPLPGPAPTTVQARGTVPRSRRPAPDHPWRRPFRPAKQPLAS